MDCGDNRQSHRGIMCIAIMLSVLVMESFGQTKWEWHKTVLDDHTNYYSSYKIVFINGYFFVLGLSNYLARSSDGISWDSIYVGPNASRQLSLAYGNAGYVLVADDTSSLSTNIWVSGNGIDWTKRHLLEGSILRATYGNDQYLISGYDNGALYGNTWTLTSSDAITWTKHNLDSMQNSLHQDGMCCQLEEKMHRYRNHLW